MKGNSADAIGFYSSYEVRLLKMVKVLGVRLSPVGDDVVVSYKAQRGKKTIFASEVIVSMKDCISSALEL